MGPRTVYAVLNEAADAYGNAIALRQPTGNGQYRTWTWTEYRDAAREIACGLRRLGVGKRDIVALYSETRAEFYLADVGIMSSGAIAAALYTSYAPPEVVKNIHGSDAIVVFVENPKAMDMLLGATGGGTMRARLVSISRGEEQDT